MSKEEIIYVYTDGACSGNPGRGGWGAIIKFGGKEVELKGNDANTTNNRMEMMAAINALEAISVPSTIHLVSDSKYLLEGVTKWMDNWKKYSWKTAAKKDVKNIDLWKRLDKQNSKHKIIWDHIKGHSGHKENERCDKLARQAIAEINSL